MQAPEVGETLAGAHVHVETQEQLLEMRAQVPLPYLRIPGLMWECGCPVSLLEHPETQLDVTSAY